MSYALNQKVFTPVPPDKGSFPLDHDGVCKKLMVQYMRCLRKNGNNTADCRESIKEYLDCRMRNELMAKEDWAKLGLSDLADKEKD